MVCLIPLIRGQCDPFLGLRAKQVMGRCARLICGHVCVMPGLSKSGHAWVIVGVST